MAAPRGMPASGRAPVPGSAEGRRRTPGTNPREPRCPRLPERWLQAQGRLILRGSCVSYTSVAESLKADGRSLDALSGRATQETTGSDTGCLGAKLAWDLADGRDSRV